MATKRNYLTIAELEEFADITVTNEGEAFDQIGQAEEMIDAYVGSQFRAVAGKLEGRAVSGGAGTITLAVEQQNMFEIDYFLYCLCEIIGGTGAGQQRRVSGSTYAGVLTLESNWSTNPNSTSFYRIYQMGKFPRKEDSSYDGVNTPARYYKYIPEEVKRAVAAQLQYVLEMGSSFFTSDKSELASEQIGDYGYENRQGSSGNKLVAPKAKHYLRGIYNRKGAIIL